MNVLREIAMHVVPGAMLSAGVKKTELRVDFKDIALHGVSAGCFAALAGVGGAGAMLTDKAIRVLSFGASAMTSIGVDLTMRGILKNCAPAAVAGLISAGCGAGAFAALVLTGSTVMATVGIMAAISAAIGLAAAVVRDATDDPYVQMPSWTLNQLCKTESLDTALLVVRLFESIKLGALAAGVLYAVKA